jgi:hypothetical protein
MVWAGDQEAQHLVLLFRPRETPLRILEIFWRKKVVRRIISRNVNPERKLRAGNP